MKKARKTALCVVAVMFAGIVCCFLWRSREPAYQGKSASHWLRELSEGLPDPAQAKQAFHAMSSNAVPFLIRTIENQPSRDPIRASGHPGNSVR